MIWIIWGVKGDDWGMLQGYFGVFLENRKTPNPKNPEHPKPCQVQPKQPTRGETTIYTTSLPIFHCYVSSQECKWRGVFLATYFKKKLRDFASQKWNARVQVVKKKHTDLGSIEVIVTSLSVDWFHLFTGRKQPTLYTGEIIHLHPVPGHPRCTTFQRFPTQKLFCARVKKSARMGINSSHLGITGILQIGYITPFCLSPSTKSAPHRPQRCLNQPFFPLGGSSQDLDTWLVRITPTL